MCDATPNVYNSKNMDNCNLLTMEDIKKLYIDQDRKQLHILMQYITWQTFFNIDYGGLPGGVFTPACPPEALHSLENGLNNHCLKQLFDHAVTKATQRKFNAVVQRWSSYSCQQYMKSYAAEYPRLLFQDGMSSISDISAGTKVGILFVIVIAALTKMERKYCKTMLN